MGEDLLVADVEDVAVPKLPHDTNAEVLPAKRNSAASVPASLPAEKPMSKKKQRKLEQLEKKRASKELRAQVLEELKAVQLKPEQELLMRATQSTHMSRRDKVAMAKQFVAMGVPVPREARALQRWKKREDKDEPSGEEGGDRKGGLLEGRSRPLEAKPPPPKVAASPQLASGVMPVQSETASARMDLQQGSSFTASATAPASGLPTTSAGPPTAEDSSPPPGEAAGAAAPAEAPPAPPPQLTPAPLRPVRVQRTERIEEQRLKLPAVMAEQEFVEMALANDVLLVCGETGCGKSTQVPQFLYEAGICNGDCYMIGVTQPRRVAAISVSQRVGEELNRPEVVGYQVRYDRGHCSAATRIKFMTDGILLREVQSDFLLRKYSVIIIDEAHERGVNCDILIGLLSRAVVRRRRNYEEAVQAASLAKGAMPPPVATPPPLRLVVMSATLRLCDFTENTQLFPTPPPVMHFDARTFPVTAHFARSTEQDYIKAARRAVLKIHRQLPPGTILVFVTGKQEVHRLCSLIRQSNSTKRKGSGKDAQAAEEVEEVEGAEEEEEEGNNDVDLLQDSDDAENAFDDDLWRDAKEAEIAGDSTEKESSQQCHPSTGASKNDVTTEGAPKKRRDADAPEIVPPRKKKRRKRREEGAQAQEADGSALTPPNAEAEAGSTGGQEPTELSELPTTRRRGKRRRAKKAGPAEDENAGAVPGEVLEVPDTAASASKEDSKADGAAKDGEEEQDISFRLDKEEDVVVLDGDGKHADKDPEPNQQRRIRMAKLDRSRTAGGVFTGAGFGEGPIRVLPLYAQLPARGQLAPFAPPAEGERLVVVATNVAETSVTLPNVRYVVDSGREKRRKYRASSGVSAFTVEHVSKASADQRAGRAGRLGPGHAYRLYSSAVYENHFTAFAPIAMLHTPMDPVLLLIAFLGVPRLDAFPWPTPPSRESVVAAIRRLRALGAIADDSGCGGDDLGGAMPGSGGREALPKGVVKCTELGYRLAAVPLAPRYAKMLLSAIAASPAGGGEEHIISHACALVAALSIGNLTCWESIAEDPTEEAIPKGINELDRLHREARKRLWEAQKKEAPRWSQLRDDADGLLWLMGGYSWAAAGGEAAAEEFCEANRVNHRQMGEAHNLMQQLGALLKSRLPLEAAGVDLQLPLRPRPMTPTQAAQLRECLADGLVDHVAVACPDLGNHAYICADLGKETPVFIHSSSNVFRYRPRPTVLVFNEIISTTRAFMRDCVTVDPMQLARRAAAGGCPLLQLGEFLPVPAPRYLRGQDQVLAFASPSYAPLGFVLPTVEVNVPGDTIFRYKVFAKALLEGEVIDGVPPKEARLLARPALLLHAPTNPRVAGLLGPLWQRRVGSREELLRRWATDSRFLLDGYLKWLPPSFHDDVRVSWPPAATKAGQA